MRNGQLVARSALTRRALGVEAARKLPVKLTIPLALLVLPGFLLLTAAPAAVGSIQRLLGPLMP
jgi:pilus assembly protein TadC